MRTQEGKKQLMGFGAGAEPGEKSLIYFDSKELEKINDPLIIIYHLNLYSYERVK
ncbi:hypothetical protein [Filobacillus milosensis]|uniref:hypothetical protein n=1 Tax=Filobacillus milosensis TaxID=94137 RepID=UPI0018912621|nr:hypothetical protein [Filobacillus milosensis]